MLNFIVFSTENWLTPGGTKNLDLILYGLYFSNTYVTILVSAVVPADLLKVTEMLLLAVWIGSPALLERVITPVDALISALVKESIKVPALIPLPVTLIPSPTFFILDNGTVTKFGAVVIPVIVVVNPTLAYST